MTILDNSHWVTTVFQQTGYAHVNRNIFKKLLERKTNFIFENKDWDKQFMHPITDYPYKELKSKETFPKQFFNSDMDNIIYHKVVFPNDAKPMYRKLKEKNNIFITTYEMENMPRYWGETLNQFNCVITPSKWSRDILAKQVTVPIHIVEWGIDPKTYYPQEFFSHKYDEKRGEDQPFIFAGVFQWTERKSPYELLQAYLQEFSSKDNVELILRCSYVGDPMDQVNIKMKIIAWQTKLWKLYGKKDFPIVRLIVDTVDDHQMRHVYQSADVSILVSRGEGFGLPILESMACGTPVITTAWGGQTDYYADKELMVHGYKKRLTGTNYNDTPYAPPFCVKQRIPYIAEIRSVMRKAYEMDKEKLYKKAENCVSASQICTWDRTVDKLEAIEIE